MKPINIYALTRSWDCSGLPQLGREFDLLRVGGDCVINVELKSGNVTDETIQKQLLQNRYYLATLGKPMRRFLMRFFPVCKGNGKIIHINKNVKTNIGEKNDMQGEVRK